jgi:hypothetical protein
MLSACLYQSLPSGLISSSFRTKTLYALLLSSTRATCPAHLALLDMIFSAIFGNDCKTDPGGYAV